MGTTIKGKKIATTKSGHNAVGPPAVSNIPPMTPPKPDGVPAPFPYTAKSSSGSKTSAKLVVGGGEALVEGCGMDVAKPGNQPSQPAPLHDLVTQSVNAKVTVTSGASSVTAGGSGIATTGDSAAMNVTAVGGQVAQSNDKLVEGGGSDSSSADSKSNRGSGQTAGEPVNVVTGDVVDEMVDLSLPGMIPVEWKRIYSSAFSDERTALGRGGWTFSLNQWVEVEAERIVLRNEDGKNLRFPPIQPRASAFERCKRLTLTRGADASFTVFSHAARLLRTYAPLVHGGRAMLREIRDAWGNRVELRYTGEHLVAIVDTAQRELRIVYDEKGRIARVDAWADGAVHQRMTYGYAAGGELARAVDALGHAEAYAYDGRHRMTEKTLTNGVRFYYEYDDDTGRCTKTWGDGGLHTVALEFDLEAGTTHLHGTPEFRKFTWNAEGAVLREETLDGDFVIATTYDEDLHVVARTNAAGEKTSYEYDARGNRTKRIDPAGNETTWEYANDLLRRRIDPGGIVTEYGHDERGALTHVRYPAGLAYSFAYDAHGRLATIHTAEGQFYASEFDAKHNLVREIDARGAATLYGYDPLGRPVSRGDALGRVTRVEYDAVGNPVVNTYADGTRTTLAYDARRNVTRVVDPLGQVTGLEYSGTGVLAKQTMPNGLAWTFGYDAMERPTEIQNPKHETYEFRYDDAGRVRRETTFDGRVLQYQYSRSDRLSRVEYPDETWRAFHYDALGNVVLETSPHGAQKYVRDTQGRLLEATVEEYSGKIVIRFERDAFGRVTASTQNGQAIRYENDARGRRVVRALPSGEVTRYHYDPLGALVAVDHDGHQVSLQRDALGREVRRHIHRGATDVQSSYDVMGRLAEQTVAAPSPSGAVRELLGRRSWTYDGLGRVRGVADDRWGSSQFEHDPADQLVQAQTGARREVFDYDAAGSLQNALDAMSPSGAVWSVRTGNLLVRTPDAEYEYDANHRRTRKIHCRDYKPTGETTAYVWDCRDRLREVALPNGDRVLYTYDAFGRRVRKEIVPASGAPERVVQFLWDDNVLASELDSEAGERVFVFEPGSAVPLLQQERKEVFTYVNDHHGTPKELVDQNGRIAWSATHSAWGRIAESWSRRTPADAVSSPFRLMGQYFDSETGLSNTRFRYFEADTGRWLSGDPLGICGGSNLFAFDGNPLLDVDPLGLMPWAWKPDGTGMGHHMIWRGKANSVGLTDLGTDRDTPTFFPVPYEERMHEALHNAQRPYVGSERGPWTGTPEELIAASGKGLKDVDHLRGELKIPQTGEVLASDVTPRQAFKKLMAWHKARVSGGGKSCG